MAPKLPLGGMYRVWVNVHPGTSDSQPITRTVAAFDVNNHLDPPVIGNLIMNQTGPFEGQLVLNLTERLASSAAQSWHNLAFQGKTYDGNTSSTNTGVLAIYFEAVNGEPARCGVPIQTHAASDAAVSVVVSNSTDRKSMQPPRVNVTRDTNSSVINLRCGASGLGSSKCLQLEDQGVHAVGAADPSPIASSSAGPRRSRAVRPPAITWSSRSTSPS